MKSSCCSSRGLILGVLNKNCPRQWSTTIYNSKPSPITHPTNTTTNHVEVYCLQPSMVLVVVNVEDSVVALNRAGANHGEDECLRIGFGRSC